MRKDIVWPVQGIQSARFTCGHCGSAVASDRGWKGAIQGSSYVPAAIYICHECTRPTLLDAELGQVPGAAFGNTVAGIPEATVERLYTEARGCMSVASYTAAVLCCRKLLMHVAVSKGAKPGASFVSYVEYLAQQGYIPPDARDWVDHIRTKSNEANHEIVIMARDDAEELVAFSEMLLKVIYEFPAAIKKRKASSSPAT